MATGTGSFFAVTMEMDGSSMSATMMTDDSHGAQLCDKVMGEIYSLATKNPSATDLKFTVQVTGKKEAIIQIQDLDAVRNYQDKEAYASSEHRGFVGGFLASAGLIQDATLSTSDLSGANSSLVGAYYESKPPPAGGTHFGVKFIDGTVVELYADGEKVGTTVCHYQMQGDNILITHACGVWHLDKRGDDYYNEELDEVFSKK